MNSLQILSFVGFTLLVAVITWWKVRKADTGSQQGYFLAGRSLKAPVIAASLMLTKDVYKRQVRFYSRLCAGIPGRVETGAGGRSADYGVDPRAYRQYRQAVLVYAAKCQPRAAGAGDLSLIHI